MDTLQANSASTDASDRKVLQGGAPFVQLLDSQHYEPCTFDMLGEAKDGMPTCWDWLEVFRKSIPQFQEAASRDSSVPESERQARAQTFVDSYNDALRKLKVNHLARSSDLPALDCIHLSALREKCLHAAGFRDPFLEVKRRENRAALALLPALLRELDAKSVARERHELAVRGVFAGNIFDLGAAESARLFQQGGAGFEATRSGLVARPWVIDDLDSLLARLGRRPYRKAVLFVDNAGSDVVLGMLPFARELLKTGTVVVLAANEEPCINDITAEELQEVVLEAAKLDALLSHAVLEQALRVVSSGNALCVIDLSHVSEVVNEEARDADLVVLEGMGRAIETNLNARFRCDALKIGMIKHREVAALLGGRMYDCVCKFEQASPHLN